MTDDALYLARCRALRDHIDDAEAIAMQAGWRLSKLEPQHRRRLLAAACMEYYRDGNGPTESPEPTPVSP